MPEQITKHTFRQDKALQVEVVSLTTLTKVSREHLLAPHRTNFYHIFLFGNCHPSHIVDFEPVQIEPYSLLFIDKNRVHQFDQALNYEGKLLIFTDDFFCTNEADKTFLRSSKLFNDLTGNSILGLEKAVHEKYTRLCENIEEELDLPADHLKHQILKNLLHNFMLLAGREKIRQGYTGIKKSADLDFTMQFCDLLEGNFINQKSVNAYAERIFISEKRLTKATLKVLGKTPKEIIKDRVLLEARRILAHTNLTIKETGINIGFEDPAYFVRYFKKYTNSTPAEFRQRFVRK